MASILVVDDDKVFIRIVQKILELGGYSVTTAFDAAGAMEYIQTEIFDLILSDANMPGGSGFDLVRTLKHDPATARIPMALLTGRRDKDDVVKGLQCGADDYIVKPLDPDIFISKVQTLLKEKTVAQVEINFAQSPVKMSARWEVKTEIVSVTEQGLKLWSSIVVAPNTKLKINSEFFESLGIAAPMLRALSCAASKSNPWLYETEVSFVGLNDSERQKIRAWINSKLSERKQERSSA